MKRDYKFHFHYNGRRREYHILADSFREAEAFFRQYIGFLQAM